MGMVSRKVARAVTTSSLNGSVRLIGIDKGSISRAEKRFCALPSIEKGFNSRTRAISISVSRTVITPPISKEVRR
jgi:hypothetical protein